MIKRISEKTLLDFSKQFKIIAVIGPRQSGKTTLVKKTFKDLPYVSFENPDIRNYAMNDPRGFLSFYRNGAVFDEAQRVPGLFSYLHEVLDKSKKTGQFIITSSYNFLLQEPIPQSLAGRIAYLNLLPFSLKEIKTRKKITKCVIKGSFPAVYDQQVDPEEWYQNYIRTYIERDVRQIKNISNLIAFEKLLKLLAARTGQLLNMNNLAIETGLDGKTIASWISILESSFIIYRLQPHHTNFNKRLVKIPKIYFYDTGVLCSLLGIKKNKQLLYHHLKENIFENFIINESIKYQYNKGREHNLFFWRNNKGREIDIIIGENENLIPVEIKSGETISQDYFSGIEYWHKLTGTSGGFVVYAGDVEQKRSSGVVALPWFKVDEILKSLR